jgi:hypothetical protein
VDEELDLFAAQLAAVALLDNQINCPHMSCSLVAATVGLGALFRTSL